MKPTEEAQAISNLNRAIKFLVELRDTADLLTVLARDDQVARQHEKDPVARRSRRITDMVKQCADTAEAACRSAETLAHPPENVIERVPVLPDCLVGGDHLAVPRPRRGLCQHHYDSFKASPYTDIADYAASLLSQVNEESRYNGGRDND